MATMITKPFGCSVRSIALVTVLALVSVAITIDRWQEQNMSASVADDEAKDSSQRRRLQSDNTTTSGDSSSSELGFPPEWEPVDCEYYTTFQDPNLDPNQGELIARWTTRTPPFWVTVHLAPYDFLRIDIFNNGEYYESAGTRVFERILRKASPNARIVDVGGNIGWFTMLAASKGHHVDVFEPNEKNVLRMCQSKWLNDWPAASEKEVRSRKTEQDKRSTVNVRKYGVGNAKSSLAMYQGNNPGAYSFILEMPPRKRRGVRKTGALPIVTLDDMANDLGWFESDEKMEPTKIVLLKVDVEGFESSVFEGARKLLNSSIIENILMEMTIRKNNTINLEMIRTIIDSGFYEYAKLKLNVTSYKNELRNETAEDIVNSCGSRFGMQCDFWWKNSRIPLNEEEEDGNADSVESTSLLIVPKGTG